MRLRSEKSHPLSTWTRPKLASFVDYFSDRLFLNCGGLLAAPEVNHVLRRWTFLYTTSMSGHHAHITDKHEKLLPRTRGRAPHVNTALRLAPPAPPPPPAHASTTAASPPFPSGVSPEVKGSEDPDLSILNFLVLGIYLLLFGNGEKAGWNRFLHGGSVEDEDDNYGVSILIGMTWILYFRAATSRRRYCHRHGIIFSGLFSVLLWLDLGTMND